MSGPGLRTSPDAHLTALAQLGALRTSTARSLISIFDKDYQYIVAEATVSISLAADLPREHHGEDLWLCGTAIPRVHGVCDYTLCGLDPDGYTEPVLDPAELPLTKIDNLTISPRFSSKPYCLPGSPAQFYAAVPIRSKRGINIGVYCVIHAEPCPGWSDADTRVLRQISDIIMDHLEAQRDHANHRRAEKMNRGLSSFLDNQSTLAGWQDEAFSAAYADNPELEGSLNSLKQATQLRSDMLPPSRPPSQDLDQEPVALRPAQKPKSSETGTKHLPPQPTKQPNTELLTSLPQQDQAHRSFRRVSVDEQKSLNAIFSRAANIIREAIETDACVFVDPTNSLFGSSSVTTEFNIAPERAVAASSSASSGEESREQAHGPDSTAFCRMLGFSMSQQHSINTGFDSPFRGRVAQKFVAALLRRYPRGRLFSFDSNGDLLSSDSSDSSPSPLASGKDFDSPLSSSDRKHSRAAPWAREHEGSNLLQLFPGARSVAFLPIWDPKKEQWNSVGFINTYQEARCFSEDDEMTFLRIFGMLIMEAVLRRATLNSDKAKSDALSCISHELRSPLHGVLLSVELLNDTSMSVFQRNVSHTIETCSRSLADTLDHLLDYSKINQFDTATDKGGGHGQPRGLRQGTQNTVDAGLMSLQSVVNLGSLAEEVVESVFAGFYFQFMSVRQLAATGASEFPDEDRNSRLDGIRALEDFSFSTAKSQEMVASLGSVAVFLMIDPHCNWTFFTEAGAMRRIIMNLFANSLKYTRKGVITVSLTQRAPKTSRPRMASKVVLTISDTGVGISQDFLDNHLFKSFSQEDSLSPGTGLGLSIVKKIVSQQKGRISVRSTLHVGTTIVVTLPLSRPEPLVGVAEPPCDVRLREFDENVRELCGLRVCLVGLAPVAAVSNPAGPNMPTLNSTSALRDICTEWLKLQIVDESDWDNIRPDLIILSAEKLGEYSNSNDMLDFPTVVLCQNALAAYQQAAKHASTNKRIEAIEFISQPIGPHKFSKILVLALHRWQDLQSLRPYGIPSESDGASSSEQEHISSPTTPPTSESYFSLAKPDAADRKTPPVVVGFQPEAQPQPMLSRQRPEITRRASALHVPYLLVDDNVINLRILCTFMTKLKRNFSTATNGQEAVDAYKNAPESFKCVFMDISMPVMDGLEATRVIRTYERENKLPPVVVIALTGLASAEAQHDAFTSGVNLFLTKPVKLAELASILKSRGLLSK
ncbi:histidine kinase [Akanthomyces lecanii RCEF 1005]|uniref:Histidine kinase n=1 Tax=Akanthomyces lecanii RCEF 1005 TaxID=1081108 RepID=A0A168F980_CORDF|nr:histidine kinase [Akanthomyces lecanii RCEF 1005]